MNPGAGDELKHLMEGVKSKTAKEDPDRKPKGNEAKGLSLKPKGEEPKALSQNAKGLSLKALGEAIEEANNNRQTIAIWSPRISVIMRYLKKTTPEFSISEEARAILEEGLEKKYPELFQKVKDGLKK